MTRIVPAGGSSGPCNVGLSPRIAAALASSPRYWRARGAPAPPLPAGGPRGPAASVGKPPRKKRAPARRGRETPRAPAPPPLPAPRGPPPPPSPPRRGGGGGRARGARKRDRDGEGKRKGKSPAGPFPIPFP